MDENKSEVLVALLKEKAHFNNLREQSWYHLPVTSTPKRWPPEYIAFYQPKAFGFDAFRIRYFGRVKEITQTPYQKLFPNQFDSKKSDKIYHQIFVEKLEQLPHPIPSRLPRSNVFISTTWAKFINAGQLNDLFDESPLEDDIWGKFKESKIFAERQWREPFEKYFYQLDFAIFCNKGKIDVEADGDTWQAQRERIDKDNKRNNDLEKHGWHVLRFNGKQIHEEKAPYLTQVREMINTLDGLKEDGIVPRKFATDGSGAQQLNLFEETAAYSTEEEFFEEIEDNGTVLALMGKSQACPLRLRCTAIHECGSRIIERGVFDNSWFYSRMVVLSKTQRYPCPQKTFPYKPPHHYTAYQSPTFNPCAADTPHTFTASNVTAEIMSCASPRPAVILT
jgi:very-short-patch-repair endonuclease